MLSLQGYLKFHQMINMQPSWSSNCLPRLIVSRLKTQKEIRRNLA